MKKIQFLLFILLHCAPIHSTKEVFAHVMMAYTRSVGPNFFDSQMKKAKSVGIDGFVLNVGNGDLVSDRVIVL